MTPYTGKDRRIFERIAGNFPIEYYLKSEEKSHNAVTLNISGGGISLNGERRLSPGTFLDMEIFSEGSNNSFICEGRAVWSRPSFTNDTEEKSFESGVEFTGADILSIGSLIKEAEKCLSA
jgi:hypothetical protein